MIINKVLDAQDTMYPSYGFVNDSPISFCNKHYSTLYGYAIEDVSINNQSIPKNSFFSIAVGCNDVVVIGKIFGVFRLGFTGQTITGKVPSSVARLSYIDGCSDELLVYPPRLGDPSFNYLYFPPNTNQTSHNHPSVRIGYVLSGSGYAITNKQKIPLNEGTAFLIEEKEVHHFITKKESMRILAFHPDGDWGPTDEAHTMLNRTHIIQT